MKKLIGSVVGATFGLVLAASSANAAFVAGTCALGDVTATTDGVTFFGASDCLNFTGNNNNIVIPPSVLAGFDNYINQEFNLPPTTPTTEWFVNGYSNDVANNDNVVNIIGSDVQSGSWTVVNPVSAYFVLTVKAGNFFSAYLFKSGVDIIGGTFDVKGATTDPNDPLKHAALSHLGIYTSNFKPQSNVGNEVPLPAALPLLASAFGVMGYVGWRRRKSSQVA